MDNGLIYSQKYQMLCVDLIHIFFLNVYESQESKSNKRWRFFC